MICQSFLLHCSQVSSPCAGVDVYAACGGTFRCTQVGTPTLRPYICSQLWRPMAPMHELASKLAGHL